MTDALAEVDEAVSAGHDDAILTGQIDFIAESANATDSVQGAVRPSLPAPGPFADIRWIRALRAGPPPRQQGSLPYGEFFQRQGEALWYAIDWSDWLSFHWVRNSSVELGQAIRPGIANGFQLVCGNAGQTGAVEPIWPSSIGSVAQDGSAQWIVSPVDATSLEETIVSSLWSGPTAIALRSGQVVGLDTYVLLDTSVAARGQVYDISNTTVTTGGQQKVGKLRIKVR